MLRDLNLFLLGFCDSKLSRDFLPWPFFSKVIQEAVGEFFCRRNISNQIIFLSNLLFLDWNQMFTLQHQVQLVTFESSKNSLF